MKTFGEIIKEKREEQNLLLREVSALTEIDQSIISKFEKGERKPSREQVIKFANIYNLPQDELIISWQSDKVAYDLISENHALEILKVAESKVEYLKTKIAKNTTVLVILDSDHSKDHVLKEMQLYSQFVTKYSYLIVEDANINNHPVFSAHGPGPMEAIEEFVKINNDFVIDLTREKFMLTFNPNGYLKKMF